MKPALARLAATLWAGALWGGALFAWRFFATLERATAGQAVTSLFATEAWIAVGCGAVLLLTLAERRTKLVVLAMLACALTIRFGLIPMMDELKALVPAGGVIDADLKTKFGLLHLASTVFFGAECVLAWLLVKRT